MHTFVNCAAIAACLAAGCATTAPASTQLGNPASRHCVDVGGKL